MEAQNERTARLVEVEIKKTLPSIFRVSGNYFSQGLIYAWRSVMLSSCCYVQYVRAYTAMHGYGSVSALEGGWHWGISVEMEGNAMFDLLWN